MSDLQPIGERVRLAELLAASNLLPEAYRKNPANVLVAIEYGRALGLEPMAAIQGINVIQGKPTASASLISSLVRMAGHKLRVMADSTKAVCEITRKDDPEFTFRSEWTMERAQAAQLTGKATWKQYPDAMLKARAITECARDACPEVLAGVQYTAEELERPAPNQPSWDIIEPAAIEPAASSWDQPMEQPAEKSPEPLRKASAKQLTIITKHINEFLAENEHHALSIAEQFIGYRYELRSFADLSVSDASDMIEDILKNSGRKLYQACDDYRKAMADES